MHSKAVPTQPLLNMLFENWLQYYSQLQNGGVGIDYVPSSANQFFKIVVVSFEIS
jgi:hypothetical protein